jgi:L-glyceraldehyde 3-phosphate reductase
LRQRDANINWVSLLNKIALQRGQTLAQMALAWVLKDDRITTVLIGLIWRKYAGQA